MDPAAAARRNALRALCCASLLLLALSGCGPAAYRWTDSSYVVQSGDTLYSIAFDHNLDYRTLARWNGISSPYTIYPGERIRLVPGSGWRPTVAAAPPPRQSSPSRTEPARSSSPHASTATHENTAGTAVSRWQWPAKGPLLHVSIPGMDPKGLNISGHIGEPIRAAADGRVVYSGSGLKGYGLLIIVKHNEHYLSAYGHNERLDVHEGDHVKAGEIIAQMGLGPQRQPMLHFEIRRDGEPIDPRRLLPASGR